MAKINVVTAKDVTFGKYRWWSDWIDVAVVDWNNSTGYLVQMKVSRTNAKKFKACKIFRNFWSRELSSRQIGNLTQMTGEGKVCQSDE